MMSKTNFHRRAVLGGLLALFSPTVSSAQEDAMNFRVIVASNCRTSCATEIAADGLIALESGGAFRAIATALAPNPIVVRLASPGGNLVGSLELGQAFREFNSTVIVEKGARCVSACVYAFLGGAVRHVAGGRIGVHRFRPIGEESGSDEFPAVLVKRAAEILTEYVARMGADPDLTRLAMSISPPAVHYLDAAELRRYRMVN
jgi:hypothetical protein